LSAPTITITLSVSVIAVLLGWRLRPIDIDRRGPTPAAGVGHLQGADVVAATAREIRGGRSLIDALALTLRRSPGTWPTLHRQLAAGHPIAAAIRAEAIERRSVGEHGLLLAGLELAHHTGGPAADTLERVLERARDLRAFDDERRVQAAQTRLSALVLTLLPIVVATWSAATSERTRDALVTEPAVRWSVAVGLAWNLVGWWWIRRIVKRAHR
jgi:tight adherence protein B